MKFSIKSLFSKCDQIRCKLGISVVFSAIWFLPLIFIFLMTLTAWKMSVFGVFLVRIFLHSDWIRRHNLSVSSPDTGKYGPEKLRIRALFTQYLILVIRILLLFFFFEHVLTLRKKWSFTLRISSINATKSAGNSGIGHTCWRNPYRKTSFFCAPF